MSEIRIDKHVNKRNIEIFRAMGISHPGEMRHTCVLCGAKTSIDMSMSARGDKLICMGFVQTRYAGDYMRVIERLHGAGGNEK